MWFEINKIHMLKALCMSTWNFQVCYRSVLIFLKEIISKCFIIVRSRSRSAFSALFVQSWLLDQNNSHLLFCQKFSITTNVFLDNYTIVLVVMKITSLKYIKICVDTDTQICTLRLYVFKLKVGLWQNVKSKYLYTLRKKIKPRTWVLFSIIKR